jgi:hypothetical protein
MQQGVPVCDTINRQEEGRLIADGKGGAVFCWIDQRNGYWNIYAQRLNSIGQKLWANQGIAICNTDSAYLYQRIVSDGEQGAIICWQDKRSGNYDIYAQHLDSLGNVLWDTNGMPVCTAVNGQQDPGMISSDSNTAIICWRDYRSGDYDGYAQKVGDEIIGITEKMQDTGYRMQDIILEIYPNPFSKTLNIRYQIADNSQKESLTIYDVSGRLVKSFKHVAGSRSFTNEVVWDGKNDDAVKLCSGVYFCILATENGNFIKKILFVKQ